MHDRWFLFGVVVGFILLLFKTRHTLSQYSDLGSFNSSLAPIGAGSGSGVGSGSGSGSGCCGGSAPVLVATGPGPGQANTNAPASGQMFYNSVGALSPYQQSVLNAGLTPGQLQFYNQARKVGLN